VGDEGQTLFSGFSTRYSASSPTPQRDSDDAVVVSVTPSVGVFSSDYLYSTIMASGMGVRGTVGRCYGFFADFQECSVRFY